MRLILKQQSAADLWKRWVKNNAVYFTNIIQAGPSDSLTESQFLPIILLD